MQEELRKGRIHALPFYPNKVHQKQEKATRIPKSELKRQKDEFLANSEETQEIRSEEPPVEQSSYTYNDYDGKQILVWLSERLEEARQWIKTVRSPPVSSDPYKQKEINKEIRDFMESGIFVLADEIVHYIEGLIFYAKYNENVFGPQNVLLQDVSVEIFGYKKIRDSIKDAKGREALMWLSRLVNCAARPLSVHEELVKQKIYQRSIAAGGLVSSQERM